MCCRGLDHLHRTSAARARPPHRHHLRNRRLHIPADGPIRVCLPDLYDGIQCWNVLTIWFLRSTVLSMSTDVVLSILPIPIVWNLRQGLKVRIYLVVVLSLGYL